MDQIDALLTHSVIATALIFTIRFQFRPKILLGLDNRTGKTNVAMGQFSYPLLLFLIAWNSTIFSLVVGSLTLLKTSAIISTILGIASTSLFIFFLIIIKRFPRLSFIRLEEV